MSKLLVILSILFCSYLAYRVGAGDTFPGYCAMVIIFSSIWVLAISTQKIEKVEKGEIE